MDTTSTRSPTISTVAASDADLPPATIFKAIDRWTAESAYETFRARHKIEYEALDRRFVALTERETPLGSFAEVDRFRR